MKTAALILAVLLSLVRLTPAQTNAASPADTKPLPTIDFLLQQVVARAVSQEDKNNNLFDMNYQYIRTRTWEYRNSAGELKSCEEKRSVENKALRLAAMAAAQPAAQPATPPPAAKIEPVSETHSNIHGKALKVKDYPELRSWKKVAMREGLMA
jgi:hypothetical protein